MAGVIFNQVWKTRFPGNQFRADSALYVVKNWLPKYQFRADSAKNWLPKYQKVCRAVATSVKLNQLKTGCRSINLEQFRF